MGMSECVEMEKEWEAASCPWWGGRGRGKADGGGGQSNNCMYEYFIILYFINILRGAREPSQY